ncbi:MAG: DUF4422 domain-containing protein [Oscillospiraceae bacterium]
MNNIQIFMCCHKDYDILPALCLPIQCGAALNPPIKGAVADNTGDNISAKNREYCELTAHYFAWKNVQAEYYGFCHYRRFFCANESIKQPYLALGKKLDKRLLGDENYWSQLVPQYEMILPKSEDMGITARQHYCTSAHHFGEDLELFLMLLSQEAPQLTEAAEKYMSQNRQYFCNMFIMNRAHFYEYCDILFSVLQKFDKQKVLHGDFQSDRTDGYLGEIFTGIYVTYCRERGEKIKELTRLDVGCPAKKRITCALLPPESKARFLAKKMVKKIRG